MEAYIRFGNESVIAPDYVLNQLVLKGMNRTYDSLISEYDFKSYAFFKIILLNEGVGFVKRNMKTCWKKISDSRIEMPEYCERSVFEALVNALIHRDYLVLGSEVHIDIYDDRLTISSPGGMPDGTKIQERDIFSVSSTHR